VLALSIEYRIVVVPADKTTISVPAGGPVNVTVLVSIGYTAPREAVVLDVVNNKDVIAVALVVRVTIRTRRENPTRASATVSLGN
jgi:hypothetical protein